MEKYLKWIGILLISGAAAVIVITSGWGWKTGQLQSAFNENPFAAAVAILTTLFIVAAILERSLAVIINIIIPQKEKTLRETAMALSEESLVYARAMGIPNGNFVRNAHEAEMALAALRERKKWFRLCLGAFIASLIATSGFHTLALIVTAENMPPGQLRLFTTIDVLLTAGLLAGGSQGIAEIINIFKSKQDSDSSAAAAAQTVPVPSKAAPAVIAALGANMPDTARQALRRAQADNNPNPDTAFSWLQGRSIYSEPQHMMPNIAAMQTFVQSSPDEVDDSAAYLETETSIHPPTTRAQTMDTSAAKASWRVAKSLTHLRDQVNAAFPNRRTASDGTIGDVHHCPGTSHHCPDTNGVVRAFDCTHDPASGCDMNEVTCAVRRSKDPRIRYVIYNHQMFSSYPMNGIPPFTWRPYSGSNPHTKHAHFSVQADAARYDDESDWVIGCK